MKNILIVIISILSCGYVYASDISGETSSLGLNNYKRPVLEWVSASTVQVENNTDTSNETKIIFPDGNSRSVTEDTSSADNYRLFDITRNSTYTSCGAGTEETGLLTGLSESNNNWYAIYAVKSQCTSGSDNFTLVGTTWAMVQSNRSILDSTFQENGYVYLGLIANGNNADNLTDIVDFRQYGYIVHFTTPTVYDAFNNINGITLASSTAVLADYVHSAGFTIPSLPSNVISGEVTCAWKANANGIVVCNSPTHAMRYFSTSGVAANHTFSTTGFIDLTLGIQAQSSNNTEQVVNLSSFIDSALTRNSSP